MNLVDVVFEAPSRRTSNLGVRALAWTAAIGAHVGLFFLAQLGGPSLETWSARMAALVHHDLNEHAPTSIETEPEPKPPAPEPEKQPEPPAPPPPAATQPQPTRARAPQPPAAAAKIVATEPAPNPNAPVDLTDNTFVTGTADAYAGGATTSRSTSTKPVERSALDTTAAPAHEASASAARPVSLSNEQWHCPWPRAALAQDLYEQAVIVRALVRADGSVESASVVSDPGNGFGAAAVDCTLHTRFQPARNARGEALRALSPPIRVRFTR